jgi:hypothetical protein
VASRIPETWCHLLIPYQSQPGPGGALWDEKKLTSGKGSLAERASECCVQEDVLFLQLGARRLRDDLNRLLWIDKPNVAVRDLVDWTRKYLFLPRVATDQVILNALVVKEEVALAQIEADRLAEELRLQIATELRIQQAARLEGIGGESGSGLLKPAVTSGPGSIGTPAPPPPPPPLPKLPTTYTASVKLDSVTAGPQVGKFLDEVMSHLQALPGVEIEMTLEVQVRAPGGIDEATARIVLENSAGLKVEQPGLY